MDCTSSSLYYTANSKLKPEGSKDLASRLSPIESNVWRKPASVIMSLACLGPWTALYGPYHWPVVPRKVRVKRLLESRRMVVATDRQARVVRHAGMAAPPRQGWLFETLAYFRERQRITRKIGSPHFHSTTSTHSTAHAPSLAASTRYLLADLSPQIPYNSSIADVEISLHVTLMIYHLRAIIIVDEESSGVCWKDYRQPGVQASAYRTPYQVVTGAKQTSANGVLNTAQALPQTLRASAHRRLSAPRLGKHTKGWSLKQAMFDL